MEDEVAEGVPGIEGDTAISAADRLFIRRKPSSALLVNMLLLRYQSFLKPSKSSQVKES